MPEGVQRLRIRDVSGEGLTVSSVAVADDRLVAPAVPEQADDETAFVASCELVEHAYQSRGSPSPLREPSAAEGDAESAAPDDYGPVPLRVGGGWHVVLLAALVALEPAEVDDVAEIVRPSADEIDA